MKPIIPYQKNCKTERRPVLDARQAALRQIKEAILAHTISVVQYIPP